MIFLVCSRVPDLPNDDPGRLQPLHLGGLHHPLHLQLHAGRNVLPAYKQAAYALQRQNAENLKQIFPEKEYRGLSPNFHIHVSVSELYIPTTGLPVLLEEICRLILGIYKSLKDT